VARIGKDNEQRVSSLEQLVFLIAVLEALRLSKAELRTHDARRVKNGPRTIQRLKEILFDDR
jgi:hypothetical protein